MTEVGSIDLARCRAAAAELAASMTLEEKAGQLTQVEKNSITPDEVTRYAIGSVLSGCGGNPDPNTPANWRAMVQTFTEAATRSRLGIPLLYGTDSVHGHGNVRGATIFPHNIGLGATGDPELVSAVHRATAVETAATGARWAFAPTVAVARDPRWGRTYEAFADDPDLVTRMGRAAVEGLQGHDLSRADSVLSCPKHYLGDGATTWGSTGAGRMEWITWWDGWGPGWRIDQGDTRIDEQTLRAVHLRPYVEAVAAGALSIMASYNSWNGDRLHGHRYLLTEVLKTELRFQGFVVSDWLGIDQLDADPYQCVVKALAAGIDMVMVPFDFRRFIANVIAAVESGDLAMGRVDDAVTRILTVKQAVGLFADAPAPPPPIDLVGCADHRRLARQAVSASAVLLQHRDGTLPVEAGTVLVAGAAADDIGLQCGGWTIEWQGGTGPITEGTTILDGLRRSHHNLDVRYDADGHFAESPASASASASARAAHGIVVVAEPPYSEGSGDRADLSLPTDDRRLIERVRGRVERLTLVLLTGRPLVLGSAIDLCDAVVVGWLPGSEGDGIADVLTGAYPFTGRLPRSWPATTEQVNHHNSGEKPQWDRGHGVQT